MHLTQQTDYSLRVLIYLACRPQEIVSTQEISSAYGVSNNHLVKVVNRLGRHGYITVKRGRGGGITLARDAAKIVIGDVVATLEPGFDLVECFRVDGKCPIRPVCTLKPVLGEALVAFLEVLNRHTLAEVVADPQSYLQYLQDI
jgi:Rrf2 family nitric oxide-sensitive transcriptional repressor